MSCCVVNPDPFGSQRNGPRRLDDDVSASLSAVACEPRACEPRTAPVRSARLRTAKLPARGAVAAGAAAVPLCALISPVLPWTAHTSADLRCRVPACV